MRPYLTLLLGIVIGTTLCGLLATGDKVQTILSIVAIVGETLAVVKAVK